MSLCGQLPHREFVHQDGCHQRPVPRIRRGTDGFGKHPLLLVPPSGLPMQAGHDFRPHMPQFQAQDVPEQRVIPEPASSDRLHERVFPGESLQGVSHLAATQECAGNVGVHLIEDARVQQQVPHIVGLYVEYLLHQVPRHSAVSRVETLHELLGIGMLRHRHGRHPQSGRPPFPFLRKVLQGGWSQGDTVLGHERGDL